MMNKQEAIIIALCRCALAGTPSAATKHQIVRLKSCYFDNGSYEMVAAIDDILSPDQKERDIFKVVQSNDNKMEVEVTCDSLIARFKKHCRDKGNILRNKMKSQVQFQSNVFELDDSLGRIRISPYRDDKAAIESWGRKYTHTVFAISNETYLELAKLYKGE